MEGRSVGIFSVFGPRVRSPPSLSAGNNVLEQVCHALGRKPLLEAVRHEGPRLGLDGGDVQPRPGQPGPDSGTSLIAAVEAGRGVAIVASVFSSVAGPRIKLRELQPSPAPLVVGVAYHPRRLGPAARQFVRTLTGLAP